MRSHTPPFPRFLQDAFKRYDLMKMGLRTESSRNNSTPSRSTVIAGARRWRAHHAAQSVRGARDVARSSVLRLLPRLSARLLSSTSCPATASFEWSGAMDVRVQLTTIICTRLGSSADT
ncbi:jg2152 [Pararge aegeria aegeria]|uniref:Jg2152 protein n=1 Tax=Pararge aegeria aegeria TaxID=348720 RepID=A0A8S4QN10_9NEOP|nr:jg2152 [Pararge aegeria aegeria]